MIENHSGRVVIGYDVKFSDANGRGMLLAARMLATSMLPEGIPDGGAIPLARARLPALKSVSRGWTPGRPAPSPIRFWRVPWRSFCKMAGACHCTVDCYHFLKAVL